LEQLALRRVKNLLDFDSQLEDGTGDEIRAQVYARFPEVQKVSATDAGSYASFSVDAAIFDGGQTEWGVGPGTSTAMKLPPGISGSSEDWDFESGSNLKIFVQNLVRADLADVLDLKG
jgi:hypothetical protein